MRRKLLMVCAVLVLLAGTARPADARMEELIDWIMELSGPGPFRGMRVEWEYMCYGRVLPVDLQTGLIGETTPSEAMLRPAHKCYYLAKNSTQMHFGLTGSVLTKSESRYPTAEPTASLDAEVTAFPFGATFDTTIPGLNKEGRVFRMLEVGGTMSGVRFSGRRFEPFWVPKFEARLTLKPGGYYAARSRWDGVLARLMVQVVGGVRPEQFGGIPGPSSGTHVKVYGTVGIDVERLIIK